MRMGESKFGAPVGIYTGKFLGVSEFVGDGKPRLGDDGKPMGPAIEWQWEITEGEQAGQKVGRITAANPTARNSCGTLLCGVLGRQVQVGEDADPNDLTGELYQIVIGTSKKDATKTQVVQVDRKNKAKGATGTKLGPNGTVTPSQYPASATPPRPPARAPMPPRQTAPTEPKVWMVISDTDEGTLMTMKELEDTIERQHLDPATVNVCKEGTEAWVTAASLGVKDKVPY